MEITVLRSLVRLPTQQGDGGMKIERFYYDESKAFDRMIEEKVEAEKQGMSEEERLRDKEQKLRGAQTIMEQGDKIIEIMRKNVSQEKVEYFEKMAKKALRVAEEMFLNVKIDSESGYMGVIEFTGEIILVNEYLDKRVIRDFRELMSSTEEIVIVPKHKEKVQITLWYSLAELIM